MFTVTQRYKDPCRENPGAGLKSASSLPSAMLPACQVLCTHLFAD